MSTEVQQILTAVRALGSKERQELAMALDQEALVSPVEPNKGLILAVRRSGQHRSPRSAETVRRLLGLALLS